MPGFTYRVIDSDGRERKGNMNASTEEQAKKRLTAEGLIIVDVDKDEFLDDGSLFGRGKITSFDLSLFCDQLTRFLKSGIGVINSLKMMAEQTDNPKMTRVINYLADYVSEGDTLSSSMDNADVFPDELLAVVEAGEKNGHLMENIEYMSAYYKRKTQKEHLVKKVTLYPALMTVVILIVLLGMFIYVVPGYVTMLSGVDIQLPISTRIMIGISNVLTKKIWILLIVVLLVIVLVQFALRSKMGRIFVSRFRLNFPSVCKKRYLDDCATFARTMTTLLYVDIPIAQALEITANSYTDHIILRRSLLRIKDQISSGGSLSKALEGTGFFPKMLINMISVGEESGKLKEMLENAAEYYESEHENNIKKTVNILEPVLVIVLAVILGTVIMSLLKPLIMLYEAVGSM